MKKLRILPALALLAACACSDDSSAAGQDQGVQKDAAVTDQKTAPDSVKADKNPEPDLGKLTALKVAAVQYAAGDFSNVSGCSDDLCGLSNYVKEAAKAGAHVVVTPEYALNAYNAGLEPAPQVGDDPATSATYANSTVIKGLAKLSNQLNVLLVFNLWTKDHSGTSAKNYNTLIAVDRYGKVAARHYKFQLFGNEKTYLAEGQSIKTSFLDTPAGKAGLLICADVQCVVTNMNQTTDCTAHAIDTLKDYFNNYKPKIVLFSAYWTVGPSNPSWWSLAVMKKVSEAGNVWVVAANTTAGSGKGGGIWKPGGVEVKTTSATTPSVLYAEIPIP